METIFKHWKTVSTRLSLIDVIHNTSFTFPFPIAWQLVSLWLFYLPHISAHSCFAFATSFCWRKYFKVGVWSVSHNANVRSFKTKTMRLELQLSVKFLFISRDLYHSHATSGISIRLVGQCKFSPFCQRVKMKCFLIATKLVHNLQRNASLLVREMAVRWK